MTAPDIVESLKLGLPLASPVRGRLFGDAAVAAAVTAASLAVEPTSLWFLAEVVRRGGTAYAAALPEPLPTGPQTDAVRPWLTAAAATVGDDIDGDEAVARWLDAVARILQVMRESGAPGQPVG
jgi:hypothetical protein